jgi:hypothetical protein
VRNVTSNDVNDVNDVTLSPQKGRKWLQLDALAKSLGVSKPLNTNLHILGLHLCKLHHSFEMTE